MSTSFNVKLWKTEVYEGRQRSTYTVRWTVAGRAFRNSHRTVALSESFRSVLVAASRRGEAFDVESGLPVSVLHERQRAAPLDPTALWFPFACRYMDMKWPPAAATYRRSLSEALTAITPAMLDPGQAEPSDGAAWRSALHRYGFNTARRATSPPDVQGLLDWTGRNSLPVAQFANADVLRRVLTTISLRLDGAPAAASVVSKRRRVLFNVVEYAIECGYLQTNPLPGVTGSWKPPKPSGAVDRRSVVNPVQARTLLSAVRSTQRSGPRLVAFFALMYFSALRPEEAANVRLADLDLPTSTGWGEAFLTEAAPYAGPDWTNDGRQRDHRQLKNRERGEGRSVPVPPELAALLRRHISEFGTGPGGRLFVGERAAELPKLTYMRTWRAARAATFTPAVLTGPLAATPYTLRHACVSTWLNAGVDAPTVAGWAGHSVEVLLRIYAKCLDGQDAARRQLIARALGSR